MHSPFCRFVPLHRLFGASALFPLPTKIEFVPSSPLQTGGIVCNHTVPIWKNEGPVSSYDAQFWGCHVAPVIWSEISESRAAGKHPSCCWHAISTNRYGATAEVVPKTGVLCLAVLWLEGVRVAWGNAVKCSEWLKRSCRVRMCIGVVVCLQFERVSWLLLEKRNCSGFLKASYSL